MLQTGKRLICFTHNATLACPSQVQFRQGHRLHQVRARRHYYCRAAADVADVSTVQDPAFEQAEVIVAALGQHADQQAAAVVPVAAVRQGDAATTTLEVSPATELEIQRALEAENGA